MKIASFNVKNKTANRLLNLKPSEKEGFYFNACLINNAKPDIIGLQEVTKEEYEFLQKRFKGVYDIYGDFRDSVGFTNEACPVMVKVGSGIINDVRTFSISKDIDKIGKKFFGAIFPRIGVSLHLNFNGKNYFLINTHIDNFKSNQKKSYAPDGPLQKIINEERNSSEKLILTGDFNSDITGPLKTFCQRNYLDDAAKPLGNTYKPLGMALDHIFYEDDLSSTDECALKNSGSDHCLIMSLIK